MFVYRRKLRWLATVKSKLFRIEEDRVKLMQLFKNFYIQIKAVPRFLIDEVEAFTLAYRYGPPNYEWEEVQRIN
ncbi:mitochondrial ribosomal protein, S26 [Culex quinquefasciatus]|uniref:Mitochondrial ribosomal protein, S26 n=1 Tax=Culex quinquefasciatus TaxID=7176 RepID=B0WJD6_CULQU|nr:mitochondrial ribosomal protein, S26 [Culex quinquefasciatus]|eukprot:XP_001848819.1 mitochondrial ribosomal protein, S26 [Culex quinquefasciatus]